MAKLSATAVVSAPPELIVPQALPDAAESKDDAAGNGAGWKKRDGWGKKVKPPSMVLDEDVNGFRARRAQRKGGGGKKGKKVRKTCCWWMPRCASCPRSRTRMSSRWRFGILWSNMTLSSQMITTNTKYGSSGTVLRERRSALPNASVLMKQWTEVVTKLRARARMSHPEKVVRFVSFLVDMTQRNDPYPTGRFDDDIFDHWSRADDDPPHDAATFNPLPAPVDRNLSGEEAYMRRIAMSQSITDCSNPSLPSASVEPKQSGEEVYLRRAAMSARNGTTHPPSPDILPRQHALSAASAPDSVAQMNADKDDDIIPGLGTVSPMDAASPNVPTLSLDQAEPAEEGSPLHVAMSGLRPTALPPQPCGVPAHAVHSPPSPPLAFNPFAPPTNVPPPPPLGQQPLPKVPTGFEEKVKAAASIAAKLSALAPPNENASASVGRPGSESAATMAATAEGDSQRSALFLSTECSKDGC